MYSPAALSVHSRPRAKLFSLYGPIKTGIIGLNELVNSFNFLFMLIFDHNILRMHLLVEHKKYENKIKNHEKIISLNTFS